MKRLTFVLILIVIVTISVKIGCGGGGGDGGAPTPDPGMLRLYIDPQILPGIDNLEIEVSRIDVVITQDLNQKGEVLTISNVPTTIKLVGFQGLLPNVVGTYPVPKNGFITQIRLIVNSAFAEIDGVRAEVKIPSGPQTGEKIISADLTIEIRDAQTTEVTTRLDTDKSLVNVNNGVIMKPVLKAVLGAVTSLPINQFVPDQIVVFFKPGTVLNDIQSLNSQIGAEILTADIEINKYRMSLPSNISVREAQSFYETSPLVDFAVPNFIGTTAELNIPNDPSFSWQWGLHNTGQTGGTVDADIDAPEAWSLQTGSRNVMVAVLDSGVNFHSDLSGNIFTNPGEVPGNGIDDDNNGYVDDINGWNFITDSTDSSGKLVDGTAVTDIFNHGTPVSGIIGAAGNNGFGIAGVNWQVTMLPVKVVRDNGTGTIDDYLDGIRYAVKIGADVLNASLRWMLTDPGDIYKYETAFNRVSSNSILHVVAAGNEALNIDTATVCTERTSWGQCLVESPVYFFPAEVPVNNLITVAATSSNDQLASFSNYGGGVDIAAPGSFILTTNAYYGGISSFSGTSAATPFVTGTSALVLAQFPSLKGDPISVKDKVLNGADKIGLTVAKGRRLNAFGALQ